MNRSCFCLFVCLAGWLAFDSAAANAAAPSGVAASSGALTLGQDGDWPHWRGPYQNGVSRETGLIDQWDPAGGDGSNVLWKRADLGTISTPITMNGKLYLLCRSEPGTKREGEKVVCVDAASGETLWQNVFNVYLSDVPDTRVSWSSCVGDPQTGHVFAQGVCGYFQCLDGTTGKTLWSRSLSEEFGLLSTYGGRTNVPIVFDDLVIVSGVTTGWGELAVPAHRFLAFDKKTGELAWLAGTRLRPEDTTYSTPILAILGGQAALVFGSGDGAIYAFQPRTGQQIWKYQFSRRGINTTPLVVDDKVYVGHSEENTTDNTMGAVACLNGALTGDITANGAQWLVKEKTVGKSSPLLIDGRLYAFDDGSSLHVLNPANGEPLSTKRFKLGSMMRSSPLFADGKIYCTEVNARAYILQPTPEGVKVLQRIRLPEGEECQGSPIASRGRVYIPTTGHLYCLGAKDHKSTPGTRSTSPGEPPVAAGAAPAHVQLIPADALVKPGEKLPLRVRLFNDRGQMLKEINGGDPSVKFSVDGGGEIDRQGVFTASSQATHVAAAITAQVGDLTGTAKVRIVPPLPWKFDFTDGEVPVTWIGCRNRHQVRELAGEKVMVKVTTIPKGTRSQGWMGPVNLHDYTVQADVRGQLKDDKLPDAGVIAQRYTLDLMGENQQLQIRSWTAQLEARFAKTIPFAWQSDQWYTLKLQASLENGQAVLRGKAWKRGEPEPKLWLIEATDATPNLSGSPGLFGNANTSEIYIDNLLVTANK